MPPREPPRSRLEGPSRRTVSRTVETGRLVVISMPSRGPPKDRREGRLEDRRSEGRFEAVSMSSRRRRDGPFSGPSRCRFEAVVVRHQRRGGIPDPRCRAFQKAVSLVFSDPFKEHAVRRDFLDGGGPVKPLLSVWDPTGRERVQPTLRRVGGPYVGPYATTPGGRPDSFSICAEPVRVAGLEKRPNPSGEGSGEG
jgi:hypothetical protein